MADKRVDPLPPVPIPPTDPEEDSPDWMLDPVWEDSTTGDPLNDATVWGAGPLERPDLPSGGPTAPEVVPGLPRGLDAPIPEQDPLGDMMRAVGVPALPGTTGRVREDLGAAREALLRTAADAPGHALAPLEFITRPIQAIPAGFVGGVGTTTASAPEDVMEAADQNARALGLLFFQNDPNPSARYAATEFLGGLAMGGAATKFSPESRLAKFGTKVVTPKGAGAVTRFTPTGEVTITVPKVGEIQTTAAALGWGPEAGMARLPTIADALNPFGGMPPQVGRTLDWFRFGEKGMAGEPLARAVQRLQNRLGNVPGLAEGEAAKVSNAFKAISEAPEEAYDAIYDNITYGTPVSPDIQAKYGSAMPALRRSLSDLSELHAKLQSIDPEVLEQYPIYLKRFIKEPLADRAARGRGPQGTPVPGLGAVKMARDAYSTTVKGLKPEEAWEFVDALPPELRPVQPAAPGRSKGVVIEGSGNFGREVTIKWPNTPEGKEGRAAYKQLVTDFYEAKAKADKKPTLAEEIEAFEKLPAKERRAKGKGLFERWLKQKDNPDAPQNPKKQREVTFSGDEDPIGPVPTEDEPLTQIKHLPTLLKRTWGDVLTRGVVEDFLAKIPKMRDGRTRKRLAEFVSWKDFHEGGASAAPDGYRFMLENGVPTKKWGAINDGTRGSTKGIYAVRNDVADYIENAHQQQSKVGAMAHGFLDRWGINVTNAPRTGLYNSLYNKIVVDPMNKNLPGSPGRKKAVAAVRSWENTGEVPPELGEAMREGLPLRAPHKGMADIEDHVQNIFDDPMTAKDDWYDKGTKWYDAIAGSPLAENPKAAAIGGGAQGAVRGIVEGRGPLGVLGEAALGAAETTVLRVPAQMLRQAYVDSDIFSTAGAYFTHLDDFERQGLPHAEAVKAAVERTIKTTQAGQWTRVGGISEAVGGSPPGIFGAQRTVGRAAQKALLNRFIKWPEVDLAIKWNTMTSGDPKAIIYGAMGLGTLWAVKEGGLYAARSMGLISDEDAGFVDKTLPTSIFAPVWDTKENKPTLVSLPGHSIGDPIFEFPRDLRETATRFTGPASQTLYENVSGESLMFGSPLKRNEPEEGTKETPVEARVRATQTTWMSPWASTGRLGQLGREAMAEGRDKPSIPEAVSSLVFGRVRSVVPKDMREREAKAFKARALDIRMEQGSAERAAVPGMEKNADAQKIQRLADLAAEYLDRGNRWEDLLGDRKSRSLSREEAPLVEAELRRRGKWK